MEKLDEITLRTGAILKDTLVRYRDTRNGEVDARRKGEFERMFVRCA